MTKEVASRRARLAGAVMLALTFGSSGGALAQQSEAMPKAEASVLSGPGVSGHLATTVDQCWASWKQEEHLHEGSNDRPDGSIVYLGVSASEVRGNVGGSSWIAARGAAFTRAELQARAALAKKIGTDLRSRRSVAAYKAGGDQSPPSPDQSSSPSNVERLQTLTGLALDSAIREFDPELEWRRDVGCGKTQAGDHAHEPGERGGRRASAASTPKAPSPPSSARGHRALAVIPPIACWSASSRAASWIWWRSP